jgi:thiol-disulfide isomerase/thioredoxin
MNKRTVFLILIVSAALIGAAFTLSVVTQRPQVAVASPSADEPASDDSAAAYEALSAELKMLEEAAGKERSTERRIDILREMDVLLAEFIDNYPGTPQAHDAAFEAGLVNFTLQKGEKAVMYLEMFLLNATDAPRDKQAFAHFYLAESYKAVGKYDDARAEYDVILNQYRDVDRRLLAAVQQNSQSLESERRLAVGSEPIAFEVTSITGEKISPEQYRGKVLLIDFWATWCAPCKQEMPNVKRVYGKYREKGFEIVGISLDRSRGDLDRYIEKNQIHWPQFFDGKYWQNEIAVKYGISSIPATILVDKKGKIRYKSLRGNQLEVAVKELLAE